MKLIERCKDKCGGYLPDHFLLPFMNRDHSYDPERQCTTYRSGAEHIFAVAGIENFWTNFCRHHAVSKGLRNPKISLPMARQQFGWISNKMVNKYFHGSLDNLIAVARALDEKRPVQNVGKLLKSRQI